MNKKYLTRAEMLLQSGATEYYLRKLSPVLIAEGLKIKTESGWRYTPEAAIVAYDTYNQRRVSGPKRNRVAPRGELTEIDNPTYPHHPTREIFRRNGVTVSDVAAHTGYSDIYIAKGLGGSIRVSKALGAALDKYAQQIDPGYKPGRSK